MKNLIRSFRIELCLFLSGVVVGAVLARGYPLFEPLAVHSEAVRIVYLVLFPGIVGAWDFTREMASDWVAWTYYTILPNGIAYAVVGAFIHIALVYGRTSHPVSSR